MFPRCLSSPLRLTVNYSIRHSQLYTTSVDADIRERLVNGMKTAMKKKDSCASTAIRSVLSEIYAADKVSKEKVPASAIISILRKALLRRNDAATQFIKASRLELADKEQQEANVLRPFLPPLLTEVDIDCTLGEVIDVLSSETDRLKFQGKLFKGFYSRVDKSLVDHDMVKRRAEVILSKK